ncbi:hypothetical protein [Leisingera daeponensis]|uniref:hypothetical protein n=1 Tax=Leisingera daeponensis TaxID=405746 RepID=UPI0021BD1D1C|nr:hypothetical protein [Leisingera daeponensis]
MTVRDPLAGKLRFHMASLAGACIAGALIIAAFTLGFYSWQSIAVCAVVAALAAWPAGAFLTRRIKRDDPAWDDRNDKPKDV